MSTCPRCGVTFSCCMKDNGGRSDCWCMQVVPPLSRQSLQEIETSHGTGDCLCPACLQTLSAPRAAPAQS